jgi:hypothetical protein
MTKFTKEKYEYSLRCAKWSLNVKTYIKLVFRFVVKNEMTFTSKGEIIELRIKHFMYLQSNLLKYK